jgi:hypothetical protein
MIGTLAAAGLEEVGVLGRVACGCDVWSSFSFFSSVFFGLSLSLVENLLKIEDRNPVSFSFVLDAGDFIGLLRLGAVVLRRSGLALQNVSIFF